MSAVDRLLFLQGGKCFYCGRMLNRQEATVDHVLPQSMGGKSDPGNIVACCRTINQYFGAMSPKEKIATILAWAGRLQCPGKTPSR